MRKLLAVLALTALAFSASSASAATRTESQRYTGTIETGTACPDNTIPLPMNVGGACFTLTTADVGGDLAITVTDDNFSPTGGFNAFEDAAGNTIGGEFWCGSKTTTIPEGAVRLVVTVDTVINATPLQCGTVAPATTGTITIAITTP